MNMSGLRRYVSAGTVPWTEAAPLPPRFFVCTRPKTILDNPYAIFIVIMLQIYGKKIVTKRAENTATRPAYCRMEQMGGPASRL